MISAHISDKEGVYSATAIRLDIKNEPCKHELAKMRILAEKVFEPLREHVGGAIKINSFFRSEELNIAIGGSTTSQHCIGEAIDIDDTFGHATNAEMFNYIKDNLSFDQLIWEHGNDDNPNWVHVSYVDDETNRKSMLKAYKQNGKTKYKKIS